MFIRIKKVKIKNKIYAYAHLVEGRWKRRKKCKIKGNKGYLRQYNNSIHKYKKSLGRVYKFNTENKGLEFQEYLGIDFETFVKKNNIDEIYRGLIGYELLNAGFVKEKTVYLRNELIVDLNNNKVLNNLTKKDVVIKIKDVSGYLCTKTISSLFNIKMINNRKEGIVLMQKLKMVGIKISPENFFILVSKLLKKE